MPISARFLAELQRARPFLPAPLARRLARAYGTRVDRLLGSATQLADLGEDLGGGLTEAEVDYLVREEWAQTPEDILWRRSKLGLHVPAETAKPGLRPDSAVFRSRRPPRVAPTIDCLDCGEQGGKFG